MRGSTFGDLSQSRFIHVATVTAARNRIRFPGQKARRVIAWLAEESVLCRMFALGHAGVVLIPQNGLDPRDLLALRGEAKKMNEGEEVAMRRYLEYLDNSWLVTLGHEQAKDRYSLVMPEEARKLGLLPSEGEAAVVYSTGENLEVWPAKAWLSRIGAVASRLEDYRDLVEAETET